MRPMRAGVLEDEVFGARVLRNEHELRQVRPIQVLSGRFATVVSHLK